MFLTVFLTKPFFSQARIVLEQICYLLLINQEIQVYFTSMSEHIVLFCINIRICIRVRVQIRVRF